MPCILLEVDTYEDIGVDVGHFPKRIVVSSNPPTLGHYIQGRAYPVKLQRYGRVISPMGQVQSVKLP